MQDPDFEWQFIDGSIVRAHQHSSGAMGKENQAIGKSVGGNTTKIHMAFDACGFPIEFDLTGGEVHDCKAAPALSEKRFKNWCRQWKINLIEELTPEWRDLYEEICS